MALCLYGFLTPNMVGGLCFGGGLGITLFGIMYMFIHDGLVHKCVRGHAGVGPHVGVGGAAEVPASLPSRQFKALAVHVRSRMDALHTGAVRIQAVARRDD